MLSPTKEKIQANNLENLNGGEIVIEFLKANGYSHIFGIPGRKILPFYDTAYQRGGIEMVVTMHEQGGSYMATCFSHMNDKGCCAGMTGPGTMNLLNGVAAAYADSIPLLVFGGQVPVDTTGKYAIQESTGIGRTPNQMKIFETVTKCATRVERIEDLLSILEKTYKTIHTGRKGPGFIEIPQNILSETIAINPKKFAIDLEEESKNSLPIANVEEIDKAIDLLHSAQNPIILLGNGASLSEAEEIAQKFIEYTNIPFTTSLPAKGLITEDHDLALGCIGIWGQKTSNDYMLNKADVILAVGTTFQELSTLGWRSFQGKKVIRIDLDKNEINRNCNAEVAILSDAKAALEMIYDRIHYQEISFFHLNGMKEVVRSQKDKFGYYETFKLDEYPAYDNGKIPAYEVLIDLGKMRNPNDVLVFDAGENAYFSQFLIKSFSKKTYIVNAGLGSMGFAAAGSVGVNFACPDRNVIAVVGDGGFLMNGNEMATAAHHNKKVIWCVLNNGILGTQKHYQRDYCEGRYIGCYMPEVDITSYAKSMGIDAVTIHKIEEFHSEFDSALKGDKSKVLNIIICDETSPKPPFFF